MADYRIVNSRVWNDEKFRTFSDDAQLLWLYCLTNPHMNSLGCYVISKATIADDLQWPTRRLDRAFSELLAKHVLSYHEPTRLLLIRNYLRYNKTFKNEASKIAVLRQIPQLPKSPILNEFIALAKDSLNVSETLANLYLKVGSLIPILIPIPILTHKNEDNTSPADAGGDIAMPSVSTNNWGTPEALVALYNAETPDECPAVDKLSPARRKKATLYLRQFPDRQFWLDTFRQIGASSFLRGLKPAPGHEHFRASLDWLLTKGKDGVENVVKTWEGRYSDG